MDGWLRTPTLEGMCSSNARNNLEEGVGASMFGTVWYLHRLRKGLQIRGAIDLSDWTVLKRAQLQGTEGLIVFGPCPCRCALRLQDQDQNGLGWQLVVDPFPSCAGAKLAPL